MKKQYEKPDLQIESFDVEDVITASGRGLAQAIQSGLEHLIEQGQNMFNQGGEGGGDNGGENNGENNGENP